MIVINSSTFRANQSKYLDMASNGNSIVVTRNNRPAVVLSPAKDFQAVPSRDITQNIADGLREVAAIRAGKMEALTFDELFNEL